MPVIRFNIDKINVEKKNQLKKTDINVKNDINIKKVSEKELSLGNTKKIGARFDFEFGLVYEPDLGSLKLNGHLFFFDETSDVKNMINSWNKEKKIPHEVLVELVNNIIVRCGVRALQLEEQVNLPPHIKFPIASTKSPTEKYIG